MNNINILIILYNERVSNCITIKSLMDNLFILSDAGLLPNIYIHNNGPESVKEEFEPEIFKYKTTLSESLNNLPLSYVYNKFMITGGDYYWILDQDSKITQKIVMDILAFTKTQAELFLPKIIDKNEVYYPIINKNKIDRKLVGVLPKKPGKIISITSGIIVKDTLSNKFDRLFGAVFDNRFALYGIDSTFFVRLKKIDTKIYIGTEMEHSLSSNEGTIQSWRYKERIIDATLQLRCYPSLGAIKGYCNFVIKNPKIFFLRNLKTSICTFIQGKHPRSQLIDSNNDLN